MLVSEAISRIRFQTNTNDDNTGRNVNALFSNKNLVAQFHACLDQYASYTKAIEDIFSYSLGKDIRSIPGPTDVIRGEGYRYIYIWRGGRRYSINIKDLNYTQTRFPYQSYSGIPQFVSIWDKDIYFYPDSSTTFQTTTLDGDLSDTATTVTVASTTGFPDQNGRITINDEKIRYQTKTATQFLNCSRGVENTTAILHGGTSTVSENNLFVFYRKRVKRITVDDNDIIFPSDLALELPIPDEHMLSIIDLTTYLLLSKLDAERAEPYKIDAAAFLEQARKDIQWGKSDITGGFMITSPFDWEVNNTGVTF